MGRVELTVGELAETAAFYRDVVGLEPLERDDGGATLGAGGEPLVELRADPEAPPRAPAGAGLFHTAVRVPSRAALGDALERIRSGWRLEGASDHYASEALYLTDPAGNGVEIYADRPREAWPRREDGTVEIGTEPLDLEPIEAAATGGTAVPAGTSIGHVHLEVTSIEAARAFYVETVGFGVQTELPAALFVAAGDYHHHLGLNTWNRRSESAGGRGLTAFEVLVPEAAVAPLGDRLAEAGVEVTDVDGGFEASDPDGIAVRFRAA